MCIPSAHASSTGIRTSEASAARSGTAVPSQSTIAASNLGRSGESPRVDCWIAIGPC